MLRCARGLLMAPLVLATLGCTGSEDQLPTVPPPPPPGTVKAAPGGVQGLPEHLMEKLKRKRDDDAAKEAAAARSPDTPQPAPATRGESPKSDPPKK